MTASSNDTTTFSKGIWKSVYVVGIRAASAAIEYVAPRVFYLGAYPTAPLSDESHGDFTVDVTVHLFAPAATSGTLTVTGAWGASADLPLELPAGPSNATVTLPAANNSVRLWWPAQTPGAQTRYAVNVSFAPSGSAAPPVSDSRLVGFRHFALVTANDSNPAAIAGVDGSGGFTMRFRVNGASIWSRGANMVPMEELEGRVTDAAHRRLVQSAVDGGFNTLRLWGGGVFQYDAWYDACDELGVLVYHDMSE